MDGACQPFLHDRHFSAASSFQIGIGRGSADILCRAPVTHAQTELVGKAVILTDGKTGTVESIWLDEMHGLRGSIRGTTMGNGPFRPSNSHRRADMVQQRNNRLADSSVSPSQQVSCSSFGTRF